MQGAIDAFAAKITPGPVERSYVLPLAETSFFAALTSDGVELVLKRFHERTLARVLETLALILLTAYIMFGSKKPATTSSGANASSNASSFRRAPSSSGASAVMEMDSAIAPTSS